MKKALVLNCSKGYNLGAKKLSDWLIGQNWSVDYLNNPMLRTFYGYQLICISVIFSWDAIFARNVVWRVGDSCEIWAGGPGLFALKNWWKKQTGLSCQYGLDSRFEHQKGDYLMTFASRGCPVGCSFCIVPKIEGLEQTLDWDFQPAPMLCDNNLSALPVDFQEHIIKRYQETGIELKDANSGFEPRTFDEGTYRRWKEILKGPWRFALDTWDEKDEVQKVMNILKDEPGNRKRVYVLLGNEPIESCYERILKVIEWGGEPHCQPMIALNALEKHPIVRFDWTEQKLMDMARWANRWLWRNLPLKEYAPRRNEASLFATM